MGRRLRVNGKIDYLTDPRLSKLTFASIQKYIEATCVSRGLPSVELKQKLFGCATKFALVSVADEFDVELETLLNEIGPIKTFMSMNDVKCMQKHAAETAERERPSAASAPADVADTSHRSIIALITGTMRSAGVALAEAPDAARTRKDVQARKAYVDLHRDRIDAALGAAMNALADARPEGPLTYLGRWLLEQGAKQGETPPVGEVEAQSEVPEALRPLRERAAEALGPIKSVAATGGGDEHAAKLPEALSTFKTLAKTEAIEAACALLHCLELNVARAPDSKEAVDALGAQLVVVDQVMATEIKKRTEGVSDEVAKELVEKCEKAITAGNKDFQRVYDNVFNVIKSGDADGTAKYEAAVGALDAAIEKPAVAEQRDEAGVAAVLFADAARVKPSFDVVVRELKAATGAGLELAVLGAKKTGLKKTSRVVEKSALRPGEGRGRSKWVCDVVRAMLVATSMSAVGSIVRGLLALHEAGALRVVRIKDRFAQPSAGGWRDLMVNFVIVGDPTRHVCEVQVVHEMMLTARKGLPGHAIYGIVRSAMELIESCGRERELRREAVRSMVAAGATDVELIGAFEDAWILEDPEWTAGVEGGRDGLGRALTADKEEGRVRGLNLRGKKWKGEALPASVARLTALRWLWMGGCTALKSVANLPASVTQIVDRAFGGCTSLASITIPESVTKIGEGAFNGCTSLASITLPSSVTQIGEQAFYGCASLSSITIPASVTQIGKNVFDRCTSLASITLPASVTQIGEWAFSGCTSLASITIPESVTQIGGHAFYGCTSLASITLPASVTQIGGGAFEGCTSLASITIPESVTEIGWCAFKGCASLASITIPSATLVDPLAFDEHTQVTFMALELIGASEDAWILEDPEWAAGMEGGREVLGRALSADKEEGRVRGLNLSRKWKGEALPASVARLTALRELTMRNCTSLKSVADLPASVTRIGDRAFIGCTSLASITLPASVTQIGGHAFDGCKSLASITIPESVTKIGEGAFNGCTSLASITLPSSVTQIGEQAFYGCASLSSITIPASVTDIDFQAFKGCTSLASITLPASVTQIGEWAFYGCTSLASITIPESVTQIGNGAFKRCTSLASITIPESVTQIGEGAFYDCKSLASITLPASVTQIAEGAFYNCTSLASITIPATVTQIVQEAFHGCTSLASITIPSSTVVGPSAFSKHTQVTRA